MTLQIVGQTDHFIVRFDDAVGAAKAVAQVVLGICESDLLKLNQHMPSTAGSGGDPFTHPPIDVQILNDPAHFGPGFGAADQNGHFPGRQSRIRINPFSAADVKITDDYAGFVFVAEMAELLMGFYGWDAGSSQGEALSRVMAEELHPASTSNFVNAWLRMRPRPDWINRNEPSQGGIAPHGDRDPIAYGCGIIFIYFLRYQLGLPYFDICSAGGSLLSDRYRHLTHAGDDPAVPLNKLLDNHFGSGPFDLVGNNPFPLRDAFIRGVLLAGKFRTQRELNTTSHNDHRNTLIVELTNRTNQPVGHYQAMDDATLTGAGAVLVVMREARMRADSAVKAMSDDDLRNTLIVEIAAASGLSSVHLQSLTNIDLVLTGLGQQDSFIRGVLLAGKFRTQPELNTMSHADHRNTLIVELTNRTNRPVGHYQAMDDATLAGAGAVLVVMREARIRDDSALTMMSDDDLRNTLIVEVASASRLSGGYLQGLTNLELVAAALRDGPLGR